MRHVKKQEGMTHTLGKWVGEKGKVKNKQIIETACDSNQMSDLIGDIKVVIINLLTELKKTMIKDVKEGIMTMSHQIHNVRNEREIYEKEPGRNCGVKKYNKKSTRGAQQ